MLLLAEWIIDDTCLVQVIFMDSPGARVALTTSEAFSHQNKKLAALLQHRDEFINQVNLMSQSLPPADPLLDRDSDRKQVEGRDISVCVRVRPMLDYEVESGYFPSVLACNPRIHALEPRLDVKCQPRSNRNQFDVDYAFGPENDNSELYRIVTMPLIDLGLKGGICTMLAYGQTGSGKTHTITGVLERIGEDLFQRLGSRDENGESYMKFYLSFFEILGNQVTDLLNDNAKLEIMEDKFGKINVRDAKEMDIRTAEELKNLSLDALKSRQTKSTFKNDTSSRSHAICCIRIENTFLKEAEDGKIFIIDLAGSENSADAQFHDKALVKEKQLINKSLMVMKECIRNRALSALNLDKYYHVPFRQSRLTLLLKDAFEVESHRLCKTVIIACVSPSCADAAMSMNTLRYVTPIKIGQFNKEKIAINPDNPANWTNEQLREWVLIKSKGNVDAGILCPFESGLQLLRLPETEFLERVMTGNPNLGEKRAKAFYTSLWKLLIDARTKERKNKLKLRKQPKSSPKSWDRELLERMTQENYQ